MVRTVTLCSREGGCQKEGKGSDMKQAHLLVLGHDLGLEEPNQLLMGLWGKSALKGAWGQLDAQGPESGHSCSPPLQ